jgi:hypothetical protein
VKSSGVASRRGLRYRHGMTPSSMSFEVVDRAELPACTGSPTPAATGEVHSLGGWHAPTVAPPAVA